MEPIRVIVIDDHRIVRDGISALLFAVEGIEVVGEAEDGVGLMDMLKMKQPDVILMDITLPGRSGIELTENITEEYSDIRVIMLSMLTDEGTIFDAIEAGAKGYLAKDATREEIVQAIKAVHSGEQGFYSEQISKTLVSSYFNKTKKEKRAAEDSELSVLTTREIEILTLFAEGLTNQEIADRFFLSIRTIESHKNKMMRKLGFNTIVDLVKYAIRKDLVEA